MATRPLPAWRYTVRQTVAMFIVASAAFALLAAVLNLFGITLSDADPFLPLTN